MANQLAGNRFKCHGKLHAEELFPSNSIEIEQTEHVFRAKHNYSKIELNDSTKWFRNSLLEFPIPGE